MKAAVYYENGGPQVLKYEDVPDPKCHPKGVVIRVEAVSVEGGDTLNRFRGTLVTHPHVVGYQAAGEIIEVGSEVKNLRVGQKVATSHAYGSHAERRAVPARSCWVVPDGLDVKLASVIPVTFGTADDCLFEFGHLKAGDSRGQNHECGQADTNERQPIGLYRRKNAHACAQRQRTEDQCQGYEEASVEQGFIAPTTRTLPDEHIFVTVQSPFPGGDWQR